MIALESGLTKRDKSDRPAVQAPADRLLPLMKRLREEPAFAFDMLLDHTAVDWIEQGRFELVYQLYSSVHGHYLMVVTSVPRDNPVTPSVCGVWQGAHWLEREVFDLMGVLYDEHPDLRRVFLDDDFATHSQSPRVQGGACLEGDGTATASNKTHSQSPRVPGPSGLEGGSTANASNGHPLRKDYKDDDMLELPK